MVKSLVKLVRGGFGYLGKAKEKIRKNKNYISQATKRLMLAGLTAIVFGSAAISCKLPDQFQQYDDSVTYSDEDEENGEETEEESEEEINQAPKITSSPITEVNESQAYNYDVNATDDDNDSLTYSFLQAPSWLSIDSQTGVISGTNHNVSSDYQENIKVKVSDGKDFATQEYVLDVYNLLDISGQLQDNETDSGQRGNVLVYDSEGNFLDKIPTDEEGNFGKQLDKKTSDLSGIVLKAGMGDYAGNYTLDTDKFTESYGRRRNLPSKDHNPIVNFEGKKSYENNAIKAVPFYSDLDGDGYADIDFNKDEEVSQQEKENFKSFMEETNFHGKAGPNDDHGLKKWNFGELPDEEAHPVFKGIQIVKEYTEDGNTYTFSHPENIKTVLEDSVYPPLHHNLFEEYEKIITISDQVPQEQGWCIIVPDETPGRHTSAQGATYAFDSTGKDGYIEGAWVELKPEYGGGEEEETELNKNFVIRHEVWGHGMNYPDPEHTDFEESIMNVNSDLNSDFQDFQPADIKGSYIVGEENYEGMEKSDDILGMEFLD